MFRKARLVGQVLRSLLLGSAAITVVASTSVVMVGCADENQPETWVKRLDDPVKRPAAVKRLVQFFNDAMTRANKDRENPRVKEVLDKTVEPLTKVYVEGNLDDRTRIELIQHLADMRDPRAKEALFKACTDFAQGKGATEDDVRWAAPAIAALKLEDGAQPLADAFLKLQAGTPKGQSAYRNLHDAMLALKSPSWTPMLLERLNRPIQRPDGTEAGKTAFQNELFWQTTSAKLLGELREASAIKPLFKTVMDPSKADVAATATMALIKIGKQAVPVLIDILTGKDEEIRDFAISLSKGDPERAKAYVSNAAVVLGAMGHPDATGPMLEVLNAATSEFDRAVIARELTKLPGTPEAVKAFQDAFEKISPSTALPPFSSNARATLLEHSVYFRDAELVPWLLKQVASAKGDDVERVNAQEAALVTAIKLMTKAQMPEVQKAVEKVGGALQKEFALASEVVTACDDQFACYLSKVQESELQDQAKQFAGIKAGTMLGVRGEPSQAQAIAEALPKIKNASIRTAALFSLNHLVRKDAGTVVTTLEKMIEEDAAKGDANRIQANEAVKEVVYRLRAR